MAGAVAPRSTPLITRLRRLVLRGPARSAGSVLGNVGALEWVGHLPEPGPFDSPPEEPVVLDGPIPWELQEGDEAER